MSAIETLKVARSRSGKGQVCQTAAGHAPAGHPGGASSSSGVRPEASVRQRLPDPDASGEYTVQGVRALLPPWHPISLSRERMWHSRWRVSCPDGAKSSATFGGKRAEHEAVAHIVQFAWRKYSEAHPGAHCPWIFE